MNAESSWLEGFSSSVFHFMHSRRQPGKAHDDDDDDDDDDDEEEEDENDGDGGTWHKYLILSDLMTLYP